MYQASTNNLFKELDNLAGKGLSLASSKYGPVVSLLVGALWKHKWKIIIGFLASFFFIFISLEHVSMQYTARSISIFSMVPSDHRECVKEATSETGINGTLLFSYGKAFADFDTSHTGVGVGFLEIPKKQWQAYATTDQSSDDLCGQYMVLAQWYASIDGTDEDKIVGLESSYEEEIIRWYQMYSGFSNVPFGNPIGLDRGDLVEMTSGYNIVRVIKGIRHVHRGVDMVPSATWYEENPGKESTDAVNLAITSGVITNFKDSYGSLCTYITNEQFRVLYCHCDVFIAQDGDTVKYGDPICFMGDTGFSTGVHTHVGIFQKNQNGAWERLDPTPFVFPII